MGYSMESVYKLKNDKVIETITIDGIEYEKTKEIKFHNEIYAEFRNVKEKHIVFLIQNGKEYKRVENTENFNKMLSQNYILRNDIKILD